MSDLPLAGRKVCIVDDDELVRKSISLQLNQHGIGVLEAADSSELFNLMGKHSIDCILMDVHLAAENGLFVQAQVRERFVDSPPIIMLSASDSHRTIIKAFRAGASDYVVKKGLNIEELLQTLRTAIERRAKDDAFKGELELLKRQSQFDEETGFYRREAIEDMLQTLCTTVPETQTAFAVLLIRVNQFQAINKQAGHVAGRQLMRAFASHMRNAIRSVDICGRFTADTFIYLVDTATTREAMDAIVSRLDTASRFELDLESMSLGVSASFAIATYPEDGADLTSLIHRGACRLDETAALAPEQAVDGREAGDATPSRVGNRRTDPRHRVFKNGKIIVNGGHSVVDCTVRDISEGGARLRLGGIFSVPQSFDLLVVGSSPARPARRIWQRSNEIGIEYTDRP